MSFEFIDEINSDIQIIDNENITLESIKSNCDELILLFNKIDRICISTEDLHFSKNIVINIGDMILRIFNNIKSIVLNINKYLDRSELRAYLDSHSLSVSKILKQPYSRLASINVASFPFSMDKMQMVDTTSAYFNKLSMEKRIKDINEALIKIYSKVINKKSPSIEVNTLKFLLITDVATDIFKMIKDYTVINDKNVVSKFGDMFSSVNEFTTYYKKVLDLENEINTAIKVSKIIKNKTYTIMEKFNKSLDRDPELIKSFKSSGKEFTQNIYNLAYLVDSYGHLIKHYHHMEHNVVNIFKALKEKII